MVYYQLLVDYYFVFHPKKIGDFCFELKKERGFHKEWKRINCKYFFKVYSRA